MPSFLVYGNDFLVSQEVRQIETNHQAQDILEGNKTVFDVIDALKSGDVSPVSLKDC